MSGSLDNLVVINYLHLVDVSVPPNEANSVLIVDPDAVLPLPVAPQGLQAVCGGHVLRLSSDMAALSISSLRLADLCMARGSRRETSILKSLAASLSLKLSIMPKCYDAKRDMSSVMSLEWLG